MTKVKIIKGRKALLLAEGCKLNKIKKDAENRLKEIKAEIEFNSSGTYKNEAGDQLVIAETKKFSDIPPKKVLDYLKKMKMNSRFPEVIKVQLTPLKKVVPETIISKWRTPLDSVLRWSWK